MGKGNIILTSSGFNDINNYVSEESRKLFREVGTGKKIMILANAAPKGTGNFNARENVRENFLSIGADEVDIIDLEENNIDEILKYDIVYGLGGDPVYLIELNKNPDFKKTIMKFLVTGTFIGESAGSMILCDDLEWVYTVKKGTKPKYDLELDTYKGLDLTEYKIFPHWNKSSEELRAKVRKYESDRNIEITKLNDGEFIITEWKQL